MNKYKCVIGFESGDGKVYHMGDLISLDEYETLTSSEKRFFNYVNSKILCC